MRVDIIWNLILMGLVSLNFLKMCVKCEQLDNTDFEAVGGLICANINSNALHILENSIFVCLNGLCFR